MKIVIAFLMAVLASVSGFSQEERPVNPVRILTAGQHIIPYKIEVTFGKATSLRSLPLRNLRKKMVISM